MIEVLQQPPEHSFEVQAEIRKRRKVGSRGGTVAGQSRILQSEAIAWISLTKGLWAIIDAADIALVQGIKWHLKIGRTCFYASTDVRDKEGCWRHRLLHRLLLGNPSSPVDHANSDGLDNRRSNLRLCSASQNACNSRLSKANSSGFKGVSFHKRQRAFSAQVRVDGRIVRLGSFATAEEAHVAYCRAAKLHYGEFARFK